MTTLNDTSIKSLFDYAKQGALNPGKDFPIYPAVYVTFVEQFADSHPPGTANGSSDLVTYTNGRLKLSADKKMLSGELKVWRNIHDAGSPAIFDMPARPEDAFQKVEDQVTVAITVSDTGVVTYQRKLKGQPIGGMPPATLNASYDHGLMVQKAQGSVRNLSFTLGSVAGVLA